MEPIRKGGTSGSITLEGLAEQCIHSDSGPPRNSMILLAGGIVSLGYCLAEERQNRIQPFFGPDGVIFTHRSHLSYAVLSIQIA
jgi:hypothetical protein